MILPLQRWDIIVVLCVLVLMLPTALGILLLVLSGIFGRAWHLSHPRAAERAGS